MSDWARVASLRTPEAFRAHIEGLGIPLDFDDELVSGVVVTHDGAVVHEAVKAALEA